jgi:hypothetical protein
MKFPKNGGWLIGAGFLLGTVGVKAATSPSAKKLYVHGVAKGLQAKAAYQDIVEQAKCEVDDIVAEANYINESEKAGAEADAAPAKPAAKAAAKKSAK